MSPKAILARSSRCLILVLEFSNDEASKKKEQGHWHYDAILLLRPESWGFRFLVQIRPFDLPGITKLKINMKGNTKRILSIKVTPSCKRVVFVDKSALKNIFSRV